jgi:hypothetical protein
MRRIFNGLNAFVLVKWNWKGISFGSDLRIYAKLSANCSPKIVMACHQWLNKSHYHIATSLIRPMRRIFNGLEAIFLVSSL